MLEDADACVRIPRRRVQPCLGGIGPDVEVQRQHVVARPRQVDSLVDGAAHLVGPHEATRLADETRVRQRPQVFLTNEVSVRILFGKRLERRVRRDLEHAPHKRWVHDVAVDDTLGVVVDLIAGTVVPVEARRGYHEDEWLLARRRRCAQNIVEVAIALRVKLIEDDAAGVEAVRACSVRWNRPVVASILGANDALGREHHFADVAQGFAALHHLRGHVEDQARLVAVLCCAEYLRGSFVVGGQKEESDRGGEFRFALLARNLQERPARQAASVLIDVGEDFIDELALPWRENERLPGPLADGMGATLLDELNRGPAAAVTVAALLRGQLRAGSYRHPGSSSLPWSSPPHRCPVLRRTCAGRPWRG